MNALDIHNENAPVVRNGVVLRSKACAYPGEVHSSDRVAVYHGHTMPTTLCGYHASPEWLPIVLELVSREEVAS